MTNKLPTKRGKLAENENQQVEPQKKTTSVGRTTGRRRVEQGTTKAPNQLIHKSAHNHKPPTTRVHHTHTHKEENHRQPQLTLVPMRAVTVSATNTAPSNWDTNKHARRHVTKARVYRDRVVVIKE